MVSRAIVFTATDVFVHQCFDMSIICQDITVFIGEDVSIVTLFKHLEHGLVTVH